VKVFFYGLNDSSVRPSSTDGAKSIRGSVPAVVKHQGSRSTTFVCMPNFGFHRARRLPLWQRRWSHSLQKGCQCLFAVDSRAIAILDVHALVHWNTKVEVFIVNCRIALLVSILGPFCFCSSRKRTNERTNEKNIVLRLFFATGIGRGRKEGCLLAQVFAKAYLRNAPPQRPRRIPEAPTTIGGAAAIPRSWLLIRSKLECVWSRKWTHRCLVRSAAQLPCAVACSFYLQILTVGIRNNPILFCRWSTTHQEFRASRDGGFRIGFRFCSCIR
jgi:hypothetical protein